jgi:small subunit ribosomal protein S3e
MLPYDPSGKIGPKTPIPDNVTIIPPKEESGAVTIHSEDFFKPAAPVAVVEPVAEVAADPTY